MQVLSLFDGISCGRLALERAGITVDRYFASEISPHAMQVSKKNFPGIIQVGDVNQVVFKDGILHTANGTFEVKQFDLVMGGSPCQDLSNISKEGRGLLGTKSSLFHQFCRIVRETRPKFFLLENVRFRDTNHRLQVSQHLGVDAVEINSSVFSAQLRPRMYWTNIPIAELPPDCGQVMRDVIDETTVIEAETYMDTAQTFKEFLLGKGLRSLMIGAMPVDVACQTNVSRANRYRLEHVRALNQKSRCLTTQCGNVASTSGSAVYVNGKLRCLSPEECERLQTLPVGYTQELKKNKRHFVIGDGWTVDVIVHILKGMQQTKTDTKRSPISDEHVRFFADTVSDPERLVAIGAAIVELPT